MNRRQVIIYLVRAGDTLDSIAAQFGLSSWRAIAEAPANNLALSPGDELSENSRIHIPPNARVLLLERLRALQRVQPELKGHFEVVETVFRERFVLSEVFTERDDASTLDDTLAVLANHVRNDVIRFHELARPIAELNVALAQTYLHSETDLGRFVAPDITYAGLNWLVTPERLELWYGMWDSAFWMDRWQGQSPAEALRLVEIHLNLVRSQIMQQSDRRIRETLSAIRLLDQSTE